MKIYSEFFQTCSLNLDRKTPFQFKAFIYFLSWNVFPLLSLHQSLSGSLKCTLLLFQALTICDFAVEAFCCEGLCGGFSSISWIYSSKSEVFFASLSSQLMCVLEGQKKPVWVCMCMLDYMFQHFSFHLKLKVMKLPNLWWWAYWSQPASTDICTFSLVPQQSSSRNSHIVPRVPLPHGAQSLFLSPYIHLPTLSGAAHKIFPNT